MKKYISIIMLTAVMCCFSSVCMAEKEQVDVNVYIEDPLGVPPVHRTPTLLPTIFESGEIH